MSYLSQKFKNTEHDDIDEIFHDIESSFNIKLDDVEINKCNTFDDLTKLVCSKIELENIDYCTSQQAFYKFRKAYYATQDSTIPLHKNSLLAEIFPKQNRRNDIKRLEQELGFKTNLLQPPNWLTIMLLVLLISSIVCLFYKPLIGSYGLILSITGFIFAFKFVSNLDLKTVSDIIKQLVQHNYHLVRNSASYNEKEIERIIIQHFVDNLDLDVEKFDGKSSFS